MKCYLARHWSFLSATVSGPTDPGRPNDRRHGIGLDRRRSLLLTCLIKHKIAKFELGIANLTKPVDQKLKCHKIQTLEDALRVEGRSF